MKELKIGLIILFVALSQQVHARPEVDKRIAELESAAEGLCNTADKPSIKVVSNEANGNRRHILEYDGCGNYTFTQSAESAPGEMK